MLRFILFFYKWNKCKRLDSPKLFNKQNLWIVKFSNSLVDKSGIGIEDWFVPIFLPSLSLLKPRFKFLSVSSVSL